MATYRAVDVQCPFYVHDSDVTILCEGLTEQERTIRRKFGNKQDCTRVFRASCAGRYAECPIYRLINRVKYGIDE